MGGKKKAKGGGAAAAKPAKKAAAPVSSAPPIVHSAAAGGPALSEAGSSQRGGDAEEEEEAEEEEVGEAVAVVDPVGSVVEPLAIGPDAATPGGADVTDYVPDADVTDALARLTAAAGASVVEAEVVQTVVGAAEEAEEEAVGEAVETAEEKEEAEEAAAAKAAATAAKVEAEAAAEEAELAAWADEPVDSESSAWGSSHLSADEGSAASAAVSGTVEGRGGPDPLPPGVARALQDVRALQQAGVGATDEEAAVQDADLVPAESVNGVDGRCSHSSTFPFPRNLFCGIHWLASVSQ
jgi:hypothetical protein